MAQPKRRTPGPSQPSTTNNQAMPSTQTQTLSSSSTSRSRSKPPPFLLLAIYPTILLTGSLFSLLEPSARAAPYSTLLQSHPPDSAPSYFARKSNVLNVYFVKVLWLWITGCFAAFLLLQLQQTNTIRKTPGNKLQSLLRYAAVTAIWIFTTQWFFGPPLIDRGFRLSGGKCEIVQQEISAEHAAGQAVSAAEVVTAAACRVAGGRWAGGHDISGHVFILILGSAFLGFEVWPVVERVARGRGWIGNDGDEGRRENVQSEWGIGLAFVSTVVGVSLWMLLMTATYFHTWFEKLTGLIVAFAGIGFVYVLPHFVPALGAILGRPGM